MPRLEVRVPLEYELDQMLQVMCDAFDLPFDAAKTVFYTDPCFDITHKRVLLAEGRIVSCLTLVPARMRIGADALPIVGVAGVATSPELQGQGLASHLLKQTMESLQDGPYAAAILVTSSPSLYKRLGWTVVGCDTRFWVQADALGHKPARPRVRRATEKDWPRIEEIHSRTLGLHHGALIRDRMRWDYVRRFVQTVLVCRDATVSGYAFLQHDEAAPLCRVLEAEAQSPRALCDLLRAAAEATGAEVLEVPEAPGRIDSLESMGIPCDHVQEAPVTVLAIVLREEHGAALRQAELALSPADHF